MSNFIFKEWTMTDELVFISKLGTHSFNKLPKKTLLKQYLTGLHQRDDFCNLNKEGLILFVKQQMEEIEQCQTKVL